jgi:hypothetical protein
MMVMMGMGMAGRRLQFRIGGWSVRTGRISRVNRFRLKVWMLEAWRSRASDSSRNEIQLEAFQPKHFPIPSPSL